MIKANRKAQQTFTIPLCFLYAYVMEYMLAFYGKVPRLTMRKPAKVPGSYFVTISDALLRGWTTMSVQIYGHQLPNSQDSDPERASFLGNMTRGAMIGALLLAVLMVAGEQVAERVDTAIFGGVFLLFGIFVHITFNMTAVVTYGLGGALIVANLNPIVAVMAATGPLAPLWFLTNSAASVGGRVVHYYFVDKDISRMSLLDAFWVCLGGQLMNSLILLVVQFFYFDLPLDTILAFKGAELIAGAVLPSFVVWYFGKKLKRRFIGY